MAWLTIFAPMFLSAQSMRLFTSDDALSSNLINALYQDRMGFIWIATEDGLNRLDEYHVTKYSHSTSDSLSLKNNYVRSLYEDTKGRFWIGCISGLQRYDREYDCFRDIPIQYKGETTDAHITAILETKSGDLWLGTSGLGLGILRHDDPRDSITIDEAFTNRLQAYYINNIFEDQGGAIWIATENALFRYSSLSDQYVECKDEHGQSIPAVMAIQSDDSGQLYVGTLNNGLYLIDENADEVIARPHSVMVKNIRTLVYDARTDVILIGTDGYGLYHYDVQEQKISRPSQFNAYFDAQKTKVHCLLRDIEGNIWMAIFQKGVVLLPNTPYKFEYIGYRSPTRDMIGSYCVTALYAEDNDNLWVGTDNDGLYHLNFPKMQSKHYISSETTRIVPNTILHISQNKSKQLCLSSYFDGLSFLSKGSQRANFSSGLPSQVKKVTCSQTDFRGNVWTGTFGEGFFGINPMTKEVIAHEKAVFVDGVAKENALSNDWINCLTLDNNGLLWVGTYHGLCCYDPISKAYPHVFSGTALDGKVVNAIVLGDDNSIWIGTTDGLFHYDPSVRKISAMSDEWDETSRLICAMIEGDDGAIWFSTHSGLHRFSKSDHRLAHFTKSDGLQGNEFLRGAATKAPDGKLYFGGVNGITAFYPKDIVPIQRKMSLFITTLNVNGRDVKMGVKSGKRDIINSALLTAKEVNLSHDDNSFMIKFSTINYINPDKTRLMYRLLPQKEEWLNTSFGNNLLSFNELPPGAYTLEIKLAGEASISDVYRLKIKIYPPWYATRWAVLGWFILLIAVTWIVVAYVHDRYRFKRNLLIREHQEQLQEAKIQYFTDISHEIRTPMTLILSPLEKLLQEKSPHSGTYKMMYRNGQTILKLINQLLDIRKIEKEQMRMHFSEVDFVQYIEMLTVPFQYNAEAKGVTFTFTHAQETLPVWIDYDQFDKVIINVLSNAFKYTSSKGHVQIELSTAAPNAIFPEGYVELQVKDNGPGIQEDLRNKIFERFYQTDNAVTGTGIGLHLAYKLVQLHHGEILAHNLPTGGACFIIRVPLGSINRDEVKENEVINGVDEIQETVPFVDTYEEELDSGSVNSRKRKPLIFFAEDNDEIRQYLIEALNEDYNIKAFQNGQELYDAIKQTCPDLVISDVMMPVMDGEKLCRELKNNPATSAVPVVLLTARVLNEELISGLESGADAYLVKPFNIDVLKATIKNQISNRMRLSNRTVTEQLVENEIAHLEVKSADEQLMERVMKVINVYLADSEFTVELLATEVGMSRVHLHRKIKQLTNLTPSALIRSIRLRRAAELLENKELTVSDAAYATGFVNMTHFSSSFKEQFGVPPSQYPVTES